jgi:hypothetical protein
MATAGSVLAASGQESVTPAKSATKARDIGGFALDMPIRDASILSPMENIGGGDYKTTKEGIDYDLGTTRLGHIYRVDSSQLLGKFVIDDVFLHSLAAKLTAKYGPPETATGETFNWSLIEPVKRAGGATLPFTTNWASAYVDDGSEGVTLHVKLIDFRIMWRDDAQLNRAPRDKAAREVTL